VYYVGSCQMYGASCWAELQFSLGETSWCHVKYIICTNNAFEDLKKIAKSLHREKNVEECHKIYGVS
jgi:hypothetical protein